MKTKTWMIPLTISIFFFTISNMASATWIKADFFSAHDDDMSYDSVLKPGGARKDYSPLAGNIAGQARDEIGHRKKKFARHISYFYPGRFPQGLRRAHSEKNAVRYRNLSRQLIYGLSY